MLPAYCQGVDQISLTTQIPYLSPILCLFPDFSQTFAQFPDTAIFTA